MLKLPRLRQLKQKAKTLRLSVKQIRALALIVALLLPNFIQPTPANAAITTAFIRFDRLEASSALTGTVCLETTTSATEAKVAVTFPSTFTTSETAADWTTTTTNLPAGATAWTTIGATATSATGATGGTVVFSSGDLTASTFYCFNFAGASSTRNAGAASDQTGTFVTQTSGDVAIDTVYYATATTASGGDQITVTASVPTTFSFSLSGNTAALGTLSTSVVTSTTPITATVSTNARNGWIAWVRNTSNGLYSTTAATDIPDAGAYGSVHDLSSTTGYGLDAAPGTGTPTIDTAYDGSSTEVGTLTDVWRQVASATAPANGNTFTLTFRAKVSGTQAAATDYTDTVTVTASGSF